MAKVAIIIYSLYKHIETLAQDVKKGVDSVEGFEADIYQVPETLSPELLKQLGAPAKSDLPIATAETLTQYDGVLFGVPTRFGAVPAQIKSFIDSTGALWANGALYQKPAGVFVSTGTGSGRETTVLNMLSTFAHHGMLFVPLSYAAVFADITNLEEVHGASAWGAGTVAGADGSRQPSALELRIATAQGAEFAKAIKPLAKGSSEEPAAEPVAKSTDTTKQADTTAKPVQEAVKPVKEAVSTTTGAASKVATKTKSTAQSTAQTTTKKGFFSKLFSKLKKNPS